MTRIHLGYVHQEKTIDIVRKTGPGVGNPEFDYEDVASVRVITEGHQIRIRVERVDDTVPVLFEVP